MKNKVLVSLVSDQTIPNVLFIRNSEIEYDKYIFVSTKKMEEKNKVKHIIKGAGINEEKCLTVVVPEDNPEQIRQKLAELSLDEKDKYCVNITGGTKIMSIGVYLFFHEKDSEIFYIPIGKQIYTNVSPNVYENYDISYRLNVQEYLNSCGVEFKMGETLKENSFTEKLFASFKSDTDAFYEDVRQIIELRNDKKIKRIIDKKKEIDKSSISETALNVFYKYMPEFREKNQIKRCDIEYLSGGWFEELVYNRLKSKGKISENSIVINIKMKRGTSENEFDVIMTNSNALYVIECKTALKDGNGKSILNETLYKLDSLKKDFGSYVKTFLVTLENLRDKDGKIKAVYNNRAGLMGIKIIDRKDIDEENMAKIILGN